MDGPDLSLLPDGGNGDGDFRPDSCPRCQTRPYPMYAACRSCGLSTDTRLQRWREMEDRHTLSVWTGFSEVVVVLIAVGVLAAWMM